MDDHGERIARIEGILSQTLPRIEDYMKQGVTARIEGNKRLATIEASVTDFKGYQESCDKDRREIATKQIAIEKQVDSLEGSRRRQIALCLGFGAFSGWLAEGGSKVVSKAMEIFNG